MIRDERLMFEDLSAEKYENEVRSLASFKGRHEFPRGGSHWIEDRSCGVIGTFTSIHRVYRYLRLVAFI